MENEMNLELLSQVAEIELVYRPKVKASSRPQISSSREAYAIFRTLWNEDKLELQEQFKVMLLNKTNRVLGIYEVSTGGVSGTIADPKLILAAAIKANAAKILLCHNHPSGSVRPSRPDELLTAKIKEAANFLDIHVEDHLIISVDAYYSFSDECIL